MQRKGGLSFPASLKRLKKAGEEKRVRAGRRASRPRALPLEGLCVWDEGPTPSPLPRNHFYYLKYSTRVSFPDELGEVG